jgi:membrane protease YdiL (CAAX protease family)
VWATALIVIGLAWAGDLGSGIFAGVVSAVLLQMGIPKLEGWPAHPPVLIAVSTLSWTWCLLAVWLLTCKYHGKGLIDGLEIRKPGALNASVAVGIGIVMAALGTLISAHWGRDDTMIARMTSTPTGLIAITVMALPMALAEEVYYRGFLFPKLRDGIRYLVRLGVPGDERILPGLAAAAVIAGWFGMIHLQQLVGPGGVDWASLSVVAFAGTIFTLQRWFTGSLVPSMITHFVYNGSLISISLILGWLGVEIAR